MHILANELREAIYMEEKDTESLLAYHTRYPQNSFQCLHQSSYILKEQIQISQTENYRLKLEIKMQLTKPNEIHPA